jgi:hypothetical protein
MDRWLMNANRFESSLNEKYEKAANDILQDIIVNAKDFEIFKEVIRWLEIFNALKVNLFGSEEDIWIACPIKDKILSCGIPVWKEEYNYMTIEFEQFMEKLVEAAPKRFQKIMAGDYA